ncbi:uncharacterized protein PFB0145c isoform X2 [Agrilus planipennis]|uniref:Uncharacterized protein PFB0145c isoform X2 n=1 Tax=Agrilus planipennis TaxID=224129 RepID=A0A7F5RGE9_AGRPL|nr:uncharacterized protein PFB0145c isoform X2 [Agrilus planipennis]
MEFVTGDERVNSDFPSSSTEDSQDAIKGMQSTFNIQNASTTNSPSKENLIVKIPDSRVSIDSETDFFNEDLNINNVPNEKIVGDVEDIVQDLENLLGEADEFESKISTSENTEKLNDGSVPLPSKFKPANKINLIIDPTCMEMEHKKGSCGITFDKKTKSYSEEIASDSVCISENAEIIHSSGDVSLAVENTDKFSICLNAAKEKDEIERKENIAELKSKIKFPECASQNTDETGIDTIKMDENITTDNDDKQFYKEAREVYFEGEIRQESEVVQDKNLDDDSVIFTSNNKILSVDNKAVETPEVTSNENNTGDTTDDIADDNIITTEQRQSSTKLETQTVSSKINEDVGYIRNRITNEGNSLNDNDSYLSVKTTAPDETIQKDRNTRESFIVINTTDQPPKTENMDCYVTTAVNDSHTDEGMSSEAKPTVHIKETTEMTLNESENSVNINDMDDINPCKIQENNVMEVIPRSSSSNNLNAIEIRHSSLRSCTVFGTDIIEADEQNREHKNDVNIQRRSEKEINDRKTDLAIADKNLESENEIKSVCFDNMIKDIIIDPLTSNSSQENASCKVDGVSTVISEFRNESLKSQSSQMLANEPYQCASTDQNWNGEDKNESLDETEILAEQSEVTQLQQFSSKVNSEEKVGTEAPLQPKNNDYSHKYEKDDYSLINDDDVFQKTTESQLNVKSALRDDEREKLDQEDNTVDITKNIFITSDVATQENINAVGQSPLHCIVETSSFPSVSNKPILNECSDIRDEKLIAIEKEIELKNVSVLETQNECFPPQLEDDIVSSDCNVSRSEIFTPKQLNHSVNQKNNDPVDVSNNQDHSEVSAIQLEQNENRLPDENDVHLNKTELNSSGFEKTDIQPNEGDLFTEHKLVIDLPLDQTKIIKPVINEAQKSERKSISYSKEIKKIFESEDATQSAVASILSETVAISDSNEIQTSNANISQLSSDTNNTTDKSTSPEVIITENNETNIIETVQFFAFEVEKPIEIGIKKAKELNEVVSSSEILAFSDTHNKEGSYSKSVQTLSHSDEVLKQPLQVDITEHTDCSEKSEEQISTSVDGECEAKNSLKITITKNKFDNMHSILKIYDPKDAHLTHEQNINEEVTLKQNEYARGESIVPKITIKPIPSTEGDFGPKYEITSKSDTDDSSNKHFTVETVEGQSSPKLRIKSVYTDVTTSTLDVCKKNKFSEREILVPRKITLTMKSKIEDIALSSKLTKYSKTGEEVAASHSPKITIKPIKLPEETREELSRSQSPKIIFKSLSKLQEQNSKTTETHGRQSPRITIKPVIKPDDSESSKELKTCPKITIKPISKPENEISDELQSRKLSLKSSQEMNRYDEQMYTTPRITIKPIKCDKDIECHNVMNSNVHTPRITIKPIVKPDHSGKAFNKYSEDANKEERRHSPRLVNKLLTKNDEEFKCDFLLPAEEIEVKKGPKLTIKPVVKPQTLLENVDQIGDSSRHIKYVVDSLEEFKEKRNTSESSNIPTVTIKPINKPDTKETQYHSASSSNLIEENIVIPKITIKPVVKQESHIEEKNTPKIIIKPLIKPSEIQSVTSTASGAAQSEIVSFVNKSNIGEVIPDIKRIKLDLSSRGESHESPTTESSITSQLNSSKITESKNYRKNVGEVELIDFEDQIKQERIVLKINKGTISSPSRSSSDKIEKLTRLKTKLAKDSIKRGYSEHINYETKKQKIEMGDVTISLIDSEDSHDSSDNVSKIGAKPNELDRDYKDSVEIIPLDAIKKKIERVDDVVVVVDPLEDIPVFEITPETAAVMKQATHLLKPGISVSNISTTTTPLSPIQTQTPRKRGRPRKVPLEVREEFKDPPKEEQESVQIFEQKTSSRPKRSCRGQSVRNTLGIKPRKPRGGGNRGRGRGRRGGKQGIVMKLTMDALSFEEKEEEPQIPPEQIEEAIVSDDVITNENNECKVSSECEVFASAIPACSTNEISSLSETFPASPVNTIQPAPPPLLEPPKSELYEEETRMSADSSRAHTPAKQTISTPLEAAIEESQSSIQSTATTESEKNQKSRKVPKQEVHLEPEGEIISADKLAEYCWGGGGPFMLQEQVAQFLGIKSFKRKYPGIQRRPVDMQERDFIRESGLASEAMCDMGLTAVKSEDILDIMYADFQPKYEEYCKHQRDRHAKDISNKQKALNLAASQEKNKLDIVEQAIHSTSTWNANFNKSRREQRKGCMDLQTFTIHFPKGKFKEVHKLPVEHYPVALVPGQFCDYYRTYSPSELSNLPLNTCTYKTSEDFLNETEDSQSEVSGSDSGSSSSDSESSDSSSGVEDCKMCRRTSSSRKLLTQ